MTVADVLTHVLVGYVVGMVLALRDDRIGPPHVTLVMVGALSPDVAKVALFVPSYTITATTGVPWNWTALHTLGGTVVVCLVTAVLVAPEQRRLAVALVAIGALTHHVLDALLITQAGVVYPLLWPLTEYRPPAGGLYRSSDRLPAVLTGLLALALWAVHRRRNRPARTRAPGGEGED